jgi:hypothetical protein
MDGGDVGVGEAIAVGVGVGEAGAGNVGAGEAGTDWVGMGEISEFGLFGLQPDRSGTSNAAAPTVPQNKNCLLDILFTIKKPQFPAAI